MCLQKSARFFLFLAALSVLAGCGAMDAIFPSSDSYKINVKINNETFDDISIVASKDIIQPFFEEPVSEDPDITELVVFLKDSKGQTVGYKAIYSLTYSNDNNNNENKTELQQDNDNSKKENNKDALEIQTKQDNAQTEKKKDETNSTNTTSSANTATSNSTNTTSSGNTATTNTTSSANSTNSTTSANTATTNTTNTSNSANTSNTTTTTNTSSNTANSATTNTTNTGNTTSSANATNSTSTSNTTNTTNSANTTSSANTATNNTTNTTNSSNTTNTTNTTNSANTAASANSTNSTNTTNAVTTNSTNTTSSANTTSLVKTSEEKKEAISGEIDIPESIKHVIKGNEIIFPVKSLDEILPFFPLPSNLPIGKYTLVFQVMGKNTILYKNEKPFFFLADAEISFEGIQVNLPGIAENSQFIQNGTVILLDAKINFDSRLDPYVVWYNGKRIINEGRYSDGAGSLLWKAPDQNGFVSLRAEVFPSWEKTGIAGYQKGISILVSSKEIGMHLLSEDTPNLVQWYTFEGALNDSISKDTEKKPIKSVEKKEPDWLSSNGTYGLASGDNNTYKLPEIPFSKEEKNIWQIISRFKPLDEGELFSVQFDPASDATMALSIKKTNLVLTLASSSSSKTYSETLKLPDDKESFVTVSVKFIIQEGRLSAKLALGSVNQTDPLINPISLEKDIDKEINIFLGHLQKNPENNEQTIAVKKTFTALWDEFAVLCLPFVEIIITKEEKEKEAVPVEEAAPVEEELLETNTPPPP